MGGVVAGVVGLIMPVGCDGLSRVASRWSGRSRGQGGVFLQDRGGQEAAVGCLLVRVGPESCSVRSAGGWCRGGRPCSAGRCGGHGG